MLKTLTYTILASALAFGAAAQAEPAPVKIGFVSTLSTPAGYLGEDARDAFNLVIEQNGGKLGGVPVELIVQDDGLKPAHGKQITDRLLQDDIKLFTGVIFSNVLTAILPDILKEGAFYVSPNAGPSPFAGKRCHKNYFAVAFENSSLHEAGGYAVNDLGYKRVALIAPNYQAGREALEGFKRVFEGEVVAEIYTKLDQSDFAVEFARLRDAKPDAIYQFHPGGAGINFAKQFANSGLKDSIPMVMPAPSMDERMLAATGDAAEGLYTSRLWSSDLDNSQTKQFVEDFREKYDRVPTDYASFGYDTANLIASALKAVDGDLSKADEFRAALKAADFTSLRGNFAFAANHHPIQDYYLVQFQRNDDNELKPVVIKKVKEGGVDPFVELCEMKD